MRKLMLISLWTMLLAIIAGLTCNLFGVSFFIIYSYSGPELHSQTITINMWLFTLWLLSVPLLVIAITSVFRRTRAVPRALALLFCFDVSVVPVLLAVTTFVQSLLTSNTNLAGYHRMECMSVLVLGFLLQAGFYYAFRKRWQTPNTALEPTATAPPVLPKP